MEELFVVKKGEHSEALNAIQQGKITPDHQTPMTPTTIQGEQAATSTTKSQKGIKQPSSCLMCLKSSSVFTILALVVLLKMITVAEATPFMMHSCIFNQQHRVRPDEATTCKYGYEVDACGNYFCTKGPRDFCGGKHERYGLCGEGLMCNKCNRCIGCSTKTFECFEDDNCIWSSD